MDLRILNTYLPTDRLHALVSGTPLPKRTYGAALFADISGFTPLTDALVRELGPQRGAEELTKHLNRVYAALINELHQYGGSVVNFSGDALTAWLDGDNGLRATAAALNMQAALHRFAAIRMPSGHDLPLAMKVAIAVGVTQRFLVGNPDYQVLDTLAGQTLEALATTEHYARKDEVVLSPLALANVQIHAEVTEERPAPELRGAVGVVARLKAPVPPQPWPPTPDAPLVVEHVRPWLLPPVYARLRSGQDEFLAELRSTVALFLQFSGIDYDHDPEAEVKLNGFIRAVQAVFAHREGNVIELTIGDKGSYLYGAFGTPIAHEDDVARALLTALDLQALAPTLAFEPDMRIGISQGRMWTGAYGGAARRTYGILGEAVNLAARLMQAAGSRQTLVSQTAHQLASTGFVWDAPQALQVKGKTQPVTAYGLRAAHQQQMYTLRPVPHAGHGDAPLFGRARECACLTECVRGLQAGQSGCVVLAGEAGIGKSRLVAEVQALARAAEIVCYIGAGDAIEKNAPYYAWRAVFMQVLPWETLPIEADARRVAVQALLGQGALARRPDLLEKLSLLNLILPLDFPESPLTAQLTDEARAESTRELLLSVLKATLADRPAVLIVEDAHWLDSASWALLVAAVYELQPLLAVVATRPLTERVPAEFLQLRRAPTTQYLALEALTPEAALALVCHRLGVAALPEPISALIRAKAEGHPFFSEELAYAMRDVGIIRINNGECQVAPGVDLHSVRFPDTVQGVITSRIDRLSPQQQLTIKVASVIGRVFSVRVLRELHPIEADRSHLVEFLDALEQLDLTPLDTPEPDATYIFKHIITQEVAYNLMLFAQRRDLHRLVAEWYERTYAEDLMPYFPLLAHHWSRAEDAPKAFNYLELAAQQAAQNFTPHEAIEFAEQALRLIADGHLSPPLLRQAQLERLLGDAYYALSEYERSILYQTRVLKRVHREFPSNNVTWVGRMVFVVMRQIAHRSLPARFIGQGAKREALLEAVRAYETLSKLFYTLNQVVPGLYVAMQSLNVAELIGPSPELARAYASQTLAASVIGFPKLAVLYKERAFDVLRTFDNLSTRTYVMLVLGIYYSGEGQLAEARRALQESADIAAQLRDWRRLGEASLCLALVLWLTGDWQGTLSFSEKLDTIVRRHGDNPLTALSYKLIVTTFGAPMSQSDAWLAEVAQADKERFGTAAQILYCSAQGAALWGRSDFAAAGAAIASAVATANSERPTTLWPLPAYVTNALIAFDLWEHAIPAEQAAARACAQQACRALDGFAQVFPVARASALVMRGTWAWRAGQPAQAVKHWQAARTLAERLGIPYDGALARSALGRYAGGPERATHLQAAALIFAQVGAARDLALVRAALGEAW